jgi:hypothetical protein
MLRLSRQPDAHTASSPHLVGERNRQRLLARPRPSHLACLRTGRDSNPRGLLTPHDFQSCSLSRSDTCPCTEHRQGCVTAVPQRRGWDSNPREPFGPDGLANRCRNHLATSPNRSRPLDALSESCPSWARTRTLLIQSQTCCQLHQGASVFVRHAERETGLEPATLSLGS